MQWPSMKTMTEPLASSTPLIFARMRPCRVGSAMTFTLEESAISSFSLVSELPSETKMYSSIKWSGVKCKSASIVPLRCTHFSFNQGKTTETLRSFNCASSYSFGQPFGRVSGGKGNGTSTSACSSSSASSRSTHLPPLHAQSPLHQGWPLPCGQPAQASAECPPQCTSAEPRCGAPSASSSSGSGSGSKRRAARVMRKTVGEALPTQIIGCEFAQHPRLHAEKEGS
mmetsp:Transcript_104901/g.301607  ORF Transcript_104901/g.301607 Transcript_104901/m.301607 type:complete len:227 (-) Transcript_104901:2-682(-)